MDQRGAGYFSLLTGGKKHSTYTVTLHKTLVGHRINQIFRPIQRSLPKGLGMTGLPFKVGSVTRCFSISFGCKLQALRMGLD